MLQDPSAPVWGCSCPPLVPSQLPSSTALPTKGYRVPQPPPPPHPPRLRHHGNGQADKEASVSVIYL